LAERVFNLQQALDLTLQDWVQFLNKVQEKPFRAKQVVQWIYQKKAPSFSAMTSLPATLRQKLEAHFNLLALKPHLILNSQKDLGTQKVLFKTHDNLEIESVLLPNGKNQFTLCLSSQAGCFYGCDFCATGKLGYTRNLSDAEIISQVLFFFQDKKISNLVFMGMGEPLANPFLFSALNKLTQEPYLNFASRSITVSTIGIPDAILQMAQYKQIKLAWSYHSGFKAKRKTLFPVLSKSHSLERIIEAFQKYQDLTKKRITIEYLLLKGVNDSKEEAEALKKLSKQVYFHLNMIPYNSHPFATYQAPDSSDIERFLQYFDEVSFEITLRKSLGQDIFGACGQLANLKI